MPSELDEINHRPELYEFYTAKALWTDEYTSKQMLSYHLNGTVDIASRKEAFIGKSVDWIASKFNVGANTKIADFGCGPGLYAYRLAKIKAQVTGIDFSKRSIEYAKEFATKEGLSINYVNEDYLEYETDESFDVILMIMCDYCALNPSQRKKMLNKFHALLNPGGYILLDVYSLNAYDGREERSMSETNLLNGFWSEDEYRGHLNIFKYEKEKVILDKYTIIEPSKKRAIYNWIKYFSPEELKKEFIETGFEVDNIYSDVAGTPFDSKGTEFAVVAKKT